MNLEKIFLVVAQNYFSSIISVSAFSVFTTKWRTNRSPAIHYIQADLGLNMADVDIAASSFLLRKGGKESCHLVSLSCLNSNGWRGDIIGSVIVSLAWSDIHQLRKSFIYSTYLLEIKYHNNCIVIRPDNFCIINISNDDWQKTDDHNQDQKVHFSKQNFRHFLGWIYKYFNIL